MNKTFIEKAYQFKRLKQRWRALPPSMILSVMQNSEINETKLDNLRIQQLLKK